MHQNNEEKKRDLIDQLFTAGRAVKLLALDPIYEIYIGAKTGALPTTLCWISGSLISLALFSYVDNRILERFGRHSLHPGKLRDVLSFLSVFCGFLVWGYYRLGMRMRRIRKLDKAFFNAHIETRLKERPQFVFDYPVDDFTRRMRLRGRGIPTAAYVSAKPTIENELNVKVVKIEHPGNNRELVDIIYTLFELPEFWKLESLVGYRDFSFPVGSSYRG